MSFNLLTMKRLNDRYIKIVYNIFKDVDFLSEKIILHYTYKKNIHPMSFNHLTMKKLNDRNIFCMLNCILK